MVYKDSDGNTCTLCTCGQEIYLAEVPGSKVWFHVIHRNPNATRGTLAAPDTCYNVVMKGGAQ